MTTDRVLIVVALLAAWAGETYARQAVRHGTTLPSGPPRYYLRAGSPQEICAPYVADGTPAWSCVPVHTVIALMLKEPPECPPLAH